MFINCLHLVSDSVKSFDISNNRNLIVHAALCYVVLNLQTRKSYPVKYDFFLFRRYSKIDTCRLLSILRILLFRFCILKQGITPVYFPMFFTIAHTLILHPFMILIEFIFHLALLRWVQM